MRGFGSPIPIGCSGPPCCGFGLNGNKHWFSCIQKRSFVGTAPDSSFIGNGYQGIALARVEGA